MPALASAGTSATAKTITFAQLAGRLPLGGMCRTLACHPQGLVHDLVLNKPDGLFAIAVQPNGQDLLDFNSTQPDNRFSGFVHLRPHEPLS